MNNKQSRQDKGTGKRDMMTIAELLAQRDARLNGEMFLDRSGSHTYTTSDEISFILQLKREGKFQAIRNLRKIYMHRNWVGRGMHVDGGDVMLLITKIVGKIPTKEAEEEYEHFARRKAFAHFNKASTLQYQQERAKQGRVSTMYGGQ